MIKYNLYLDNSRYNDYNTINITFKRKEIAKWQNSILNYY